MTVLRVWAGSAVVLHASMQRTPTQLGEWMRAAGWGELASDDWIENTFVSIYR